MTTVVDIEEAQTKLRGLLALAGEGDEIIIKENGEELGKITSSAKQNRLTKRIVGLGSKNGESGKAEQRVFGRGEGKIWMSDDFNEELPDEFWGFDKEL